MGPFLANGCSQESPLMANKKKKIKARPVSNVIATNRKALRDFEVLSSYEAGVVLVGTEVKSVRDAQINLRDAYCRVENGELIMHGCDIQPYKQASHEQHAAKRPRKLLLHRHEIDKISEAIDQKGLTIVALKVYWKNRRIKIEIGVARGKSARDQRHDLKKRQTQRETDREIARFSRQ